MNSITAHKKLANSGGIYISRRQLLALRDQRPTSIAQQSSAKDSAFFGELLSTLKGHGIEFADIRPYQPGDEMRHIDWRTTARTGTPYTREYIKESQQTVYLAVDQRSGMFFGSGQEFKSVCGARIAGLIAWASAKRNLKLGATVVGEWPVNENALTAMTISNRKNSYSAAPTHPGANNTHHYYGSVRTGPSRKTTLTLINELAVANGMLTSDCAADTHAAIGLQKLIELTATHAQDRSTVYIISDFHGFDSACAKTIAGLGRKCTLVMVLISDPLEDSLNITGTVGISDGDNLRALHMSAASRARYQQKQRKFHELIQRSAEQSNATLLHHVLAVS